MIQRLRAATEPALSLLPCSAMLRKLLAHLLNKSRISCLAYRLTTRKGISSLLARFWSLLKDLSPLPLNS